MGGKNEQRAHSGYSMNGREHKTLYLARVLSRPWQRSVKKAEKTSIAATKTDRGEERRMLLWKNSIFK